jgi:hypothetical protein
MTILCWAAKNSLRGTLMYSQPQYDNNNDIELSWKHRLWAYKNPCRTILLKLSRPGRRDGPAVQPSTHWSQSCPRGNWNVLHYVSVFEYILCHLKYLWMGGGDKVKATHTKECPCNTQEHVFILSIYWLIPMPYVNLNMIRETAWNFKFNTTSVSLTFSNALIF